MIRLLFPGHQYNRDHGIFISNTILQLIYYIGEGHMIFKKVIKGGHRSFFRVFVHFSVNCFPSFSKNKVFQQISGIKIKCICFRIIFESDMGHSSGHTCHAKFNRKLTFWSVPVSNATLDKDTLTKAPGTARMTISKTTSTFAGMAHI